MNNDAKIKCINKGYSLLAAAIIKNAIKEYTTDHTRDSANFLSSIWCDNLNYLSHRYDNENNRTHDEIKLN